MTWDIALFAIAAAGFVVLSETAGALRLIGAAVARHESRQPVIAAIVAIMLWVIPAMTVFPLVVELPVFLIKFVIGILLIIYGIEAPLRRESLNQVVNIPSYGRGNDEQVTVQHPTTDGSGVCQSLQFDNIQIFFRASYWALKVLLAFIVTGLFDIHPANSFVIVFIACGIAIHVRLKAPNNLEEINGNVIRFGAAPVMIMLGVCLSGDSMGVPWEDARSLLILFLVFILTMKFVIGPTFHLMSTGEDHDEFLEHSFHIQTKKNLSLTCLGDLIIGSNRLGIVAGTLILSLLISSSISFFNYSPLSGGLVLMAGIAILLIKSILITDEQNL